MSVAEAGFGGGGGIAGLFIETSVTVPVAETLLGTAIAGKPFCSVSAKGVFDRIGVGYGAEASVGVTGTITVATPALFH